MRCAIADMMPPFSADVAPLISPPSTPSPPTAAISRPPAFFSLYFLFISASTDFRLRMPLVAEDTFAAMPAAHLCCRKHCQQPPDADRQKVPPLRRCARAFHGARRGCDYGRAPPPIAPSFAAFQAFAFTPFSPPATAAQRYCRRPLFHATTGRSRRCFRRQPRQRDAAIATMAPPPPRQSRVFMMRWHGYIRPLPCFRCRATLGTMSARKE